MKITPSYWDALMINVESACQQRTFWITAEAYRKGFTQTWCASKDGGFLGPCIDLPAMQTAFDAIAQKFPHRWTFVQEHDEDGNLDPRVLRDWQQQYQSALFIRLHTDGSWGENQWISVLFEDDAQSRQEAMLFKTTFC